MTFTGNSPVMLSHVCLIHVYIIDLCIYIYDSSSLPHMSPKNKGIFLHKNNIIIMCM